MPSTPSLGHAGECRGVQVLPKGGGGLWPPPPTGEIPAMQGTTPPREAVLMVRWSLQSGTEGHKANKSRRGVRII